MPDLTNLATKAAFNTKTTDAERKIPDITNLATKNALNTEATETENKKRGAINFITFPEFNKLRKLNFDFGMKETSKSLAINSEIKNALDLEYKIQKTLKSSKKL